MAGRLPKWGLKMSNVVGWVNRVRTIRSARAGRVVALLGLGLSLTGAAGCSGEIQGEGAEVGVTNSALTWVDGANTITVEAEVEEPACAGEQAQLGVTGTFTSNATHTIALIVTIDGVPAEVITVARPANFAPVGRNFVASFGTDVNVPNGAHRIDLCFARETISGLSPVRACLPSVDIDVDCTEEPPPVDIIPPVIEGSASPSPNAAGWNNTDVHVSFVCSDADSGIASCTAPVTLSAEGAGQSVSGTAVDNAGNSASTTVSGIHIDKTAPSISASRSVAPNAAGWNRTPVTVSFTCDDALSGVASCSVPMTLSSEGAGQSASGVAVDVAGNSAAVAEGPINIDMTAPTLAVSGGGVFMVDQNVNATCTATDALSGVASTSCGNLSGPAYQYGVGKVTLPASATDHAGNVANGSVTITIKVDGKSLCALTKRFASNQTYAKAACTLLESAQQDIDRRFKLGASIKLLAYVALVALGRGSVFTSAEVAILTDLAGGMF